MRSAILDLPVPLEPVCVDLDEPLEDQLPAGRYLEAAQAMLKASTKPIKITVKFDEGVPPEAQGVALLAFERHLRALTKLDCRVFKERMGDDSKLRVMMTKKEKDSL